MQKLPISALVASCNEGHYLEDCLKSLQFCDEIYGVDMDSSDESREIFQKYANTVERFHQVPMIEELHPVFIPKLKHDWIILIDPDERITPELADSIKQTLETVPSDIAALRVPMINYFKKKPLKGTIYGGVVYARLLYRRSGVSVDNDVHRGIKLKSGYDRKRIPFTGANYDKHLWCESWSQLFDKHARYLRGEGQSRFNSGMRYSLSKQWMATITKFYYNFKGLKGYLDGWRGFCISLLQARYEFLAWRGLRKYSKKQTY